ncbi:MAG: glycine--tRNA ligase [Candidatus Eremiobacteraeota bacterium]|nr:glycine--tRNA ligase [Candidatus Eremiobacteraeota bacterium]
MEKIVSLCKRRGFIFQSSEIYGGLNSCYDYGPMGVLLKNNVKNSWWKSNVQERDDVVGLDSSILMHPQVWVASGHVESFTDPMVDCKECKLRFRADHVEGDKCPECGGELTDARLFNLMFKTFMGAVEDTSSVVHLRPETAQGIFVNFKNVQTVSRKKLPFGIAQIGKAFRNEITPGKFTFRTREFEMMELEYFTYPEQSEECHQKWLETRMKWYADLGIKKEKLRLRRHEDDELAHYALSCYDVEYEFPWGWSELEGIANRTDYDLKAHEKDSGKDMKFFDEERKEHIAPFVIEPSAGVDRSALAFLVDAYDEDETPTAKGGIDVRTVLRFSNKLAPIKAAVLPLSKKEPLPEIAEKIYKDLRKDFYTDYDIKGSIGKRYRRQDEVGTPFCITVDFDTIEDNAVTVRFRDTLVQERIPIEELKGKLKNLLEL